MLVTSNKPEVLRLQNIEQKERGKFISEFSSSLLEILPSNLSRRVRSSLFLMQVLSAVPDIYYTLVTLCLCKRRLGQEYTYIAMYKQKHYQTQGVLLNRKTRILLAVLELVGRQFLTPLAKLIDSSNSPVFEGDKGKKLGSIWARIKTLKEGLSKWAGSAQELMSNVEWMIMMVYMLDWNKHFTFLETMLGISYVYTYKNDQIRDVSYAIEGYLLLATFAIKAIKLLYGYFTRKPSKKQPPGQSQQKSFSSESAMKKRNSCRICYDSITQASSTKCGHVFCWNCIIKSLQISPQCPVCRQQCLPREVVQLRNS